MAGYTPENQIRKHDYPNRYSLTPEAEKEQIGELLSLRGQGPEVARKYWEKYSLFSEKMFYKPRTEEEIQMMEGRLREGCTLKDLQNIRDMALKEPISPGAALLFLRKELQKVVKF